MVKIIAMFFLFFKKNADIMCPKIAPINDIMMMVIDPLGVLWNRSIPISNIFCPIAVEIARNVAIGNSSRTYFLIIPPICGSECCSVLLSFLGSKWVS